MAFDPTVADQLTALTVVGAQESARLTGMADRNLTQGLGVIQNTLIQSNGATSDDAQQFGSLRTAIHVPAADGK